MAEPTDSTGTTATKPSESKFQKTDFPTLLSKSRKAQDIKIYVIPYFLKIYEELFVELDNIKTQKNTEKTIVTKKGLTAKELKTTAEAKTEYEAAKTEYDKLKADYEQAKTDNIGQTQDNFNKATDDVTTQVPKLSTAFNQLLLVPSNETEDKYNQAFNDFQHAFEKYNTNLEKFRKWTDPINKLDEAESAKKSGVQGHNFDDTINKLNIHSTKAYMTYQEETLLKTEFTKLLEFFDKYKAFIEAFIERNKATIAFVKDKYKTPELFNDYNTKQKALESVAKEIKALVSVSGNLIGIDGNNIKIENLGIKNENLVKLENEYHKTIPNFRQKAIANLSPLIASAMSPLIASAVSIASTMSPLIASAVSIASTMPPLRNPFKSRQNLYHATDSGINEDNNVVGILSDQVLDDNQTVNTPNSVTTNSVIPTSFDDETSYFLGTTSRSDGGFKQSGGASDREAELREMIDFVHRLLLDLNMYSNPEYLDWLYHYARVLGFNIFENFDITKFGQENTKTISSTKSMRTKIFMDAYKIGTNREDPNNPADEYETQIRTETYGINAAKRTDNLFKYVFNAKRPFKQKYIPLPIVSEEYGLTRNPLNPNTWLSNSTSSSNNNNNKTASSNTNSATSNSSPAPGSMAGGGSEKQKKYRYLEDSILCRHFEDCVDESVKNCKVHLCVFSIDRSCSLEKEPYPFLKFIVRPQPRDNPEIYEFISFQYDVIPDDDATEDFKCALYEKLLTELDLSLSSKSFECVSASEILDSVYRGIKSEEIDGQHHVFAFFDFDAILEHSKMPEAETTEDETTADVMKGGDFIKYPGVLEMKSDAVEPEDKTGSLDQVGTDKTGSLDQVGTDKTGSLDQVGTDKTGSLDQVGTDKTGSLDQVGTDKTGSLDQVVSDKTGSLIRGQYFPSQLSDDNISTPYRWAIIDELLFERNMYGVYKIDPVIPIVFVRNEILWNIFDENNNWIDFPFSVYSTTIKETGENGEERFDNVRVPVDIESAALRKDAIVLPPEIDVYGREDEYGQRFCFTYLPLPREEKEPLPKRYAVFTTKPEYLVKDEDFDVFDAPAEVVGGGGDLEEDVNTDSEDQSTEDIDKDLIKKLETPVIYFIANNEYTNNKPVVMWGVKHDNRFVAL